VRLVAAQEPPTTAASAAAAPGRIVALLAIAIAAAGLTKTRLAHPPGGLPCPPARTPASSRSSRARTRPNGYLDSGRVDASRYVPQKIDFTPSMRHTTIAEELAAAHARPSQPGELS
jgi:hypothetical protein